MTATVNREKSAYSGGGGKVSIQNATYEEVTAEIDKVFTKKPREGYGTILDTLHENEITKLWSATLTYHPAD